MKCPHCGSTNTRVIDSNPHKLGRIRRRECMACQERFTTLEQVYVRKSGGEYAEKTD